MGRDGKEEIEMVNLKQQTTPMTMKADFHTLHLCQDIVMERFVEYRLRDPYRYRRGDVKPTGQSLKNYGQMECYHRVRL